MGGTYYHATPADNVPGILASGLRPQGANSHVWGDYIHIPDGAIYLADSIVSAENWGSEVAQAVMRAEDPEYDPDAEAEGYEPGPFDDGPWMPSHFYVEIAILEVQVPDGLPTEINYHPDGKEVIVYGTIPPGNIRLVKTFSMAESPERFGLYFEASSTWGDDPESQKALEDLADAILSSPTHVQPFNPADYYGGTLQQGRGEILLNGQRPTKLYRVVDPGEWADAEANGYLQSRGGYTRASVKPDERWRYQGEAGVRGLTLEIDYDPADEWTASAEGYAATWNKIPLSRVRVVGSKTAGFEDWQARGVNDWYDSTEPLTVYHGTTEDHLEGIRRDGLTPPTTVNPAMWFMVTTERGQAAGYTPSDPNRTSIVLEYRIPADQVTTYLWPPHEHDVYGYTAWAMGLRKPLPASMLVSSTAASKTASSATVYRGLRLRPSLTFDEFYLDLANGDLDAAANYVIEDAVNGYDRGTEGLGMHWTTDFDTARRFAATSSEQTVVIDPESAYLTFPVIFEATYQPDAVETNEDALWAGGVEGYNWDGRPEFEVTIRQGAQVALTAVHLAVPEDAEMVKAMFGGDWESGGMILPYRWVRQPVGARSVLAKTASYDTDPVGWTWSQLQSDIDGEDLVDLRGMPSGTRDPSRPVYVRFGEWPADERSTNNVTGDKEEGVSVYEVDDRGLPTINWEGNHGNAEGDLISRIHHNVQGWRNDPVFLVQGDEVGFGQDGEPLLRNVRAIERIASRREDAEEMGVREGQPLYRFIRVSGVDIDFDSGMSLSADDILPHIDLSRIGGHWTTSDDLWDIALRHSESVEVRPGEVPVRLMTEGWTWDQVADRYDESYYYGEEHSNDPWGPEREIPLKPGTPITISEIAWMDPDEEGRVEMNGNPQWVSLRATAAAGEAGWILLDGSKESFYANGGSTFPTHSDVWARLGVGQVRYRLGFSGGSSLNLQWCGDLTPAQVQAISRILREDAIESVFIDRIEDGAIDTAIEDETQDWDSLPSESGSDYSGEIGQQMRFLRSFTAGLQVTARYGDVVNLDYVNGPPWFHGTEHTIPVGGIILPGTETGLANEDYNRGTLHGLMNKVFFTDDVSWAEAYSGDGHVYMVRPIGPIYDGGNEAEFCADSAEVLAEVDPFNFYDAKGFTPQWARAMYGLDPI